MLKPGSAGPASEILARAACVILVLTSVTRLADSSDKEAAAAADPFSVALTSR
jgi:hypothetical protein